MDSMIKFCVLVLGAVSTVAAYAGITTSLPHDSFWWLAFAALVAVAIGVGVATLWHVAFEAVANVVQGRFQVSMWIATIVGCIFIALISAYWHVAALGGPAAMNAAVNSALRTAELALSQTESSRNAYRSLLARVDTFVAEVTGLADCEGTSGCVTGSAGKEGVHDTLRMIAEKSAGIAQAVQDGDVRFDQRLAEGRACLADFRTVLAAGTEGDGGMAQASATFDCVNAVVAEIDGNVVLERIAQEMEALTAGLVVPVTVKSPAQREAVANIMSSLQQRASAVAADARKATSGVRPEPISLNRMSAMQAVVIHYDAILPAWATGIALDIWPLVLMVLKSVMLASKRAAPDIEAGDMTASDLVKALRTIRALQAELERPTAQPRTDAGGKPKPDDATVRFSRAEDEADFWEETVDFHEERTGKGQDDASAVG